MVITRWKVLPDRVFVSKLDVPLSKFLFILRTDSLVVPKPQNSKKCYDDKESIETGVVPGLWPTNKGWTMYDSLPPRDTGKADF